MFSTNLKIIFRSLSRNRMFSLINLSGLSIGIACVTLISLYVSGEYSFDRFHTNTEKIYQVTIKTEHDGTESKWNAVPNQVGPAALKDIPEVEKSFRILYNDFTGKAFVTSEKLKGSEQHLVWVDNDMFSVLSIPFIYGHAESALSSPHTVVISAGAAIKYFGKTDVLGKGLKIGNDTLEYEITGVVKDAPANSRFQFPVMATFLSSWANKSLSWGNASFETYLQLHEKADVKKVDARMEEMLARSIKKDDRWFKLELHPLKDIHLQYPDVDDPGQATGDLKQVKILVALGLIILIIAAVNYMNLATAQSQHRHKEIGVAKTMGATRVQLAGKFYLETAFFVLLAILIGLALTCLSLPFFNDVTGKIFTLAFLTSGVFWFGIVAGWAVLTLLAGIYPSFYLSAFNPTHVLKGGTPGGGSGNKHVLRKTLVVTQFAISTILIVCTVVFYQQLEFIRNKKLGYEPEQVVAIGTGGAQNAQQVWSLKSELERLPVVSSVARSQSFPGANASGRNLRPLTGEGDGTSLRTVRATPEIADVLSIHLIAGKMFPLKQPEDTTRTVQVVLNRSAIRFLGLTPEEAVNRKVRIGGFQGDVTCTGVMEDFNYSSLHEPIGAYCFHNARTEGYQYLLVKVRTSDLPSAMAQIGRVFGETIPSMFEYTFLDQHLQVLYQAEQRMAKIVFIFAALAIFIACLGLYALAAYSTERRKKEIGIRKVLGATVFQLSNMLSADFIKLVVVSFVIAAPIGWYIMDSWLHGFSYQIKLSWIVFAITGFTSVMIAWVTVGLESMRAASDDPVKALRTE